MFRLSSPVTVPSVPFQNQSSSLIPSFFPFSFSHSVSESDVLIFSWNFMWFSTAQPDDNNIERIIIVSILLKLLQIQTSEPNAKLIYCQNSSFYVMKESQQNYIKSSFQSIIL